jgi:hypothetical protein
MGRRARQLFKERFRADIIYPKLVNHLEAVVSQKSAAISTWLKR